MRGHLGRRSIGAMNRIRPDQGSYLTPSPEHATVADAMHAGILSCPADATLTMVARIMAMHHVHCVAVEGMRQGEATVWGVVSDMDVVRALDWQHEEPAAGELAHAAPVTIAADAPLLDAARLMVDGDVQHLVVLSESGRPVGVLSGLDVAGVAAWGRG
jgi:CBS domain-containing protein